MRRLLSSAIILLSGTLLASPANAWNIICGVSIFMDEREDNRKWDADSSALYGISHFYAAIAEMQRIQLREDRTFVNPTSERSEKKATEQAALELKMSLDAFSRSLKLAEQLDIGDDKGLGLLKKLVEGVSKLYDTVEFQRTLPTLSAMQEVAKTINEYTVYGIELSTKHLAERMRGHGEGGSDYRIPD